MPRLIDADKIFYTELPNTSEAFAFRSLIDKMPTVDAVRHGHWKVEEWINTIFCSECGNSWHIMDNDTETFNYCPNCGARMDEVEDDRQ